MASPFPAYPIIGHRGAPFLVPPGNTLASLRRAVEAGALMLEVDVRRTRDDVLVLDHENVHLLDGEDVPLRERSFSHWQTHGGEWGEALTTLEEAFALARETGTALMLDFKEPGTETALARAVRGSGLPYERVLIAGAGESSRRILRGLDPRIPLSLTLDIDQKPLVTADLLLEVDTDAVTWHHQLLTAANVDVLHRRDKRVYAWTVDLSEDIRRMFHICKVDGIITNSPDMVKKALR